MRTNLVQKAAKVTKGGKRDWSGGFAATLKAVADCGTVAASRFQALFLVFWLRLLRPTETKSTPSNDPYPPTVTLTLDNRIGMDENGSQTWTLYDGSDPVMDFSGGGSLVCGI